MTDEFNGLSNDKSSEEEEEERAPEFVPSRPGRLVSVYGLVERIIEQFNLEHGEDEIKTVKQSSNNTERRKMIRDIADYVFGVEGAQLSLHEQARIIALALAEIFGYGPLDKFFADETVSTITLEGTQKISLRYGGGQELEPIEPIFENTQHLRRIISRLLKNAGAQLRDDVAIIEVGLIIEGRRVSVSVVSPPFVPELSADIRVHPKELPTLASLIESGFMNETAKTLLQAIMRSEQGVIIIGDTESGKTTLLSILLQDTSGEGLVTVERAGELALPENAEQLVPIWPVDDDLGTTFGESILAALRKEPKLLILDEVRTDEPESIAPLLIHEDVPRQIWSFRGASDARRITSALGILARLADRTQPEHMVFNLYQRLPFMVIVKRRKGYLQLREIAEWQFPEGYENADDFVYADYVPLLEMVWDECKLTGKYPRHGLDLPADFWG
jgi:Flp pilus assembly CpaF family ATPase